MGGGGVGDRVGEGVWEHSTKVGGLLSMALTLFQTKETWFRHPIFICPNWGPYLLFFSLSCQLEQGKK